MQIVQPELLLPFQSGTRLGFQQSAAPLGWTKDTTTDLNDSIMRIVTGAASNGGTNGFSSVNAQTAVGATTLTTAQIPSHQHYVGNTTENGPATTVVLRVSPVAPASTNSYTGNAGSGSSHDHTISMSIKYRDFIIASKD